jgi:hypothetical protein
MCSAPKAAPPPAPPPAAPPVLQQVAPATADKNRREERSKRGLSRYKIESTQNKISSKYGSGGAKSAGSLGGIPKKTGTG